MAPGASGSLAEQCLCRVEFQDPWGRVLKRAWEVRQGDFRGRPDVCTLGKGPNLSNSFICSAYTSTDLFYLLSPKRIFLGAHRWLREEAPAPASGAPGCAPQPCGCVTLCQSLTLSDLPGPKLQEMRTGGKPPVGAPGIWKVTSQRESVSLLYFIHSAWAHESRAVAPGACVPCLPLMLNCYVMSRGLGFPICKMKTRPSSRLGLLSRNAAGWVL